MKRTIIAIAIFATLGLPARADVTTTGGLARQCQSDAALLAFCYGYVAASIEIAPTIDAAAELALKMAGGSDWADVKLPGTICPPRNATVGQAVALFVRWAGRHPERWHEDRGSGVYGALKEAWPCE